MRHDKKLERLQLYSFRLAPETLNLIREKAKQSGIPTGEMIRQYLDYAIDKNK